MGIKHRADIGLRNFSAPSKFSLGGTSTQLRNALRFIPETLCAIRYVKGT
jgi:hypothetical protein